MNSSEVRSIFLNYFKKNQHQIIKSSSLVPENDPTLMFANSGMVQFKNIFTGKEERDYKKAVTAQKCVRAGGKHNDLENVGYTARHHTFFEMLGNFSFGDYFKDVAIELAWNLITKEYQIDKKKLVVTVYEEDIEAFNLWKKIAGLSDDKIIKINSSDNFWSMGDTGPCGPCSEIFYDHGENFAGGPPGSKDEDGDRYIEIWNLVFMQYEQLNKTKRINLPKPSIDTGMGLERIVALLNNTNDNYQTDIFIPLIEKSMDLSNNSEKKNLSSHKIIADHLRSSSFLIADGVLPSNEGRGYVLRRIMRRGMRHAHTLGNKDPVFHKLFPTLLAQLNDAYPELNRAKELILNTFKNEETKFKTTIDKGLKILEDEISNSKDKILDGSIAFKLYDTFGFPIDLTQDYLKNKSMSVDIKKFESEMLEQKQRARKNWKGTGDQSNEKMWFDITQNLEPTEFLGYDQVKSESIIKRMIVDDHEVNSIMKDKEASILLNQTPFYGESGGQVGDIGMLINENFNFEIMDTIKIHGKYILHKGRIVKGKANVNDQVTAIVNEEKRELIKNNHSSTHLLHASLRHILGKHVTQKGSLVNSEKLRFDFSHNETIDKESILKIENLVNTIIIQNNNVLTEILDHDQALKSGAMALFGEKYGDEVRVVSMGNYKDNFFSIELCGGIHVNKTGDIKNFKIINQSSIASGVRRIEALTSFSVDKYNLEIDKKNAKLKLNTKNELIKYLNLLNSIDKNKKYEILENKNLDIQLKNFKSIYEDFLFNIDVKKNNESINIENINEYIFVFLLANKYPGKAFKNFIDDQKKINPNRSIICLVSTDENKVSIIIGVTKDLSDKVDARKLVNIASKIVGGGGGGGRIDLAQSGGNITNNVNSIYDAIKKELLNLT